MTELFVKDREPVVPGEELARGMDYIPAKGAYRLGESIYAQEIGLVQIDGRAIKLVPLAGAYVPKRDDVIIAKVIDIAMSGWRVDTRSAYSGMIGLRDGSSDFIAKGADLSKYFAIGDYMVAKITNVTTQKLVDLTAVGPGLRRLRGGQIVEIGCKKVPRVIGKRGSMVTMVKDATGCHITVGQNGRIWINGTPKGQVLAVETIRKIADEAHTTGLTEKIRQFLLDRVEEMGLETEFGKEAPVEDENVEEVEDVEEMPTEEAEIEEAENTEEERD